MRDVYFSFSKLTPAVLSVRARCTAWDNKEEVVRMFVRTWMLLDLKQIYTCIVDVHATCGGNMGPFFFLKVCVW